MTKLIAVTIGDIDGLGIHLLIKEWKKGNIKNFIIISNFSIIKKNLNDKFSNFHLIKNNNEILKYNKKKINILDVQTKNKYTNSIDSLYISYNLTKQKIFRGILTLPLNKKKINNYVDKNFIDHTTFFTKLDNKKESNMIFVYRNKFFIPLTTHIELKKVSNFFKNKKNILNKINNINNTLTNDFNIKKPKLIISGINPHAGENGLISKEETKYLIPNIKILSQKKINIKGPFSADGMINKPNLKNYDVFIFAFHDQALIPFKILSNFEGVNYTSNLDIIRVSPSHGTATQLINSKNANSNGIVNCFKLINTVYKNRNKN